MAAYLMRKQTGTVRVSVWYTDLESGETKRYDRDIPEFIWSGGLAGSDGAAGYVDAVLQAGVAIECEGYIDHIPAHRILQIRRYALVLLEEPS